jgi:hypothetical protein
LAAALGFWLALTAAPAPPRAETPVELELVLAVDTSSSVDRQEFQLQMQGLARAFRHPDVLAALEAAGPRGVAVALLQWSSTHRQTLAVPWTHLTGPARARAFAARLGRTPRYVRSGGTGIAGALDAAAAELAENGFTGQRRAIDVSGDGRANMGARPTRARDRVTASGITINGLAILNEESTLDRYYLDSVIGGPGAFLITAAGYDDFARAIRRKLIREIAGARIVEGPGTAPGLGPAQPTEPPSGPQAARRR